jgi:hypothetical protein
MGFGARSMRPSHRCSIQARALAITARASSDTVRTTILNHSPAARGPQPPHLLNSEELYYELWAT